jgi:hypothetical protein
MLARAKTLLFTALLLGLVQSHADTQPGDPLPLSVEIDQPRSLILERVSYQRTANGIEVSGRVAKQSDRRGRILGHVDITLLDAQGQPLARHVATLQQFSPSRKNPDWAGFSTRIEPLPAGVQGLRVGHRVGG